MKNGVLNLPEIQYQNGHGNRVSDGLLQPSHDQTQTTLALGQAEPPLHFDTLTFIQKVLCFVTNLILFRPAKGRTCQVDPALLTKTQIVPISIDFVGQYPAGVVSFPFPETLHHGL